MDEYTGIMGYYSFGLMLLQSQMYWQYVYAYVFLFCMASGVFRMFLYGELHLIKCKVESGRSRLYWQIDADMT